MSDFNDMIIAEFRANAGFVETAGFGDNLVLLHTTGAKSGAERVSPLAAIVDEDYWDVAGSAAGSTKHPAWFFNILAEPNVAVETGTATIPVHATVLEGTVRDAAWARFVASSSAFAGYVEKAGDRIIPVVRLRPRS